MKENYRPRIADKLLKKKLEGIGAVLMEGPKFCGKTTTAEQIASSVLYMAQPDKRKENIQIAQMEPSLLLKGAVPRLIDEWQIAPELWDSVRFEVDHRDESGQFILTGSSVPANREKIFHSGTGRIAWLKMRPMSLFESGDSNGSVSLQSLFSGCLESSDENNASLEQIAYLVCRGGWPTSLRQAPDTALERVYDYYDGIIREDVQRMDGAGRNPDRIARLMRSYARNQGTQASTESICKDMKYGETDLLDSRTVLSYIDALKKIFVIEDMPAWNPNLRSKTVIRTSETRYFVDPSIGVAALGLGPGDLLNDLNTFGLLFETLCVRDLRVYADSLGGSVYHYRDKNGLECDAAIHLRNGSYGLVEIKLGGETAIEHGADTLKKLSSIMDYTKMKEPAFCMVLTAVGTHAYKRKDNIFVVPVCCLKD